MSSLFHRCSSPLRLIVSLFIMFDHYIDKALPLDFVAAFILSCFAILFFRPRLHLFCATSCYFLSAEVMLSAPIPFFHIHHCCHFFNLIIFTARLLSWTLDLLLLCFKRKVLSCLIINWDFMWLICLFLIAYYFPFFVAIKSWFLMLSLLILKNLTSLIKLWK